MPAFTISELLSELRLRIATGGMMPIPQLGLVETELMWRCMWDVAETQIYSELVTAQDISVVDKDHTSGSSCVGDRGQGLKLGVGTGAGGGSAFSIFAHHHHHPTSFNDTNTMVPSPPPPVTVTVSQDYLSHYNLKCSREFVTEVSSSSSLASSIRQADVNAAKMYFEVANGCSDTQNGAGGGDGDNSRPSTANSISSSSIPNKKFISLKSSRNFSHELCRRFIRTVAEIIGEKGAKWDVHIEFPHFGILRIKDRILDFTPVFSQKLAAIMGSSSMSNVVATGGGGGGAVVMSKPPLSPFGSGGGGGTSTTNNNPQTDEAVAGGGGGGSPLQRVLRQQARERMLLQKHGDSYIRARVDAKKSATTKGGFNSAGIGAPHSVVDTSDTDSLFTIRPSSKCGGMSSGNCNATTTTGKSVPVPSNTATAVADMKRLLISHRHIRPLSSSSTTPNNSKNTELPQVGGVKISSSSPQGRSAAISGAALVRSLDNQLQELRNQISGPLESVEGDLVATTVREEGDDADATPSKQQQRTPQQNDSHNNNASSKNNKRSKSSSVTAPIPSLPTTRQLNYRHPQQFARRSAKLLDNDGAQEQAMKARTYKQELDLQNNISSTTKKSKKQLEIDADSRRIEIDVLTAARNILVGISDKKTMTAQMSVEAADIAKKKDIKHEKDMLRRAGKRGKHHPQPKHIV